MQFIALILLGALTGTLSGLLGIGGGIILVPALNQLFNVSLNKAIGTSLLIIIPAAISGSYTHYTQGNLEVKTALLVMVGAIVGGMLGAKLINHIPELWVKRVFGIFILYIGVRMLLGK